jgi:APA family basic amino acid/polyamine antiporter
VADASYKCPWVPMVPCMGIYFNIYLMFQGTTMKSWKILGSFEVLGVLFYVFYGFHKSKLSDTK